MGVVLGWVALALTGVAVAPHAVRNKDAQVTYTVRMVEADGVGWREAVFTSLKPVTRQGAATVWTVPQAKTALLLREFAKSPATKITQAPRVTAFCGAAATIHCRTNRSLVSQVAWNHGEPESVGAPEKVRVGWHTTMIGRKLDQGILMQIVLEDTVVRAVHHVNVSRPDKLAGTTVHCAASDECCARKASTGDDHGVQKVVLEVPEIDTQEIVGEWLVPRGEVLLVSLGAYTAADKAGKAIVKERLAIIEAGETGELNRVAGMPGPLPFVSAPVPLMTGPAPTVPMPTPIMPSRSIPRGVHADGTPADLPPLPADEIESDSTGSESSEPMPSPQTKKIPPPKPATDSGANKAEFSLPKAATMFLPSFLMPGTTNGFQFMLPIKPLSIKLPFGQKLEVEIFGKIVADQPR